MARGGTRLPGTSIASPDFIGRPAEDPPDFPVADGVFISIRFFWWRALDRARSAVVPIHLPISRSGLKSGMMRRDMERDGGMEGWRAGIMACGLFHMNDVLVCVVTPCYGRACTCYSAGTDPARHHS